MIVLIRVEYSTKSVLHQFLVRIISPHCFPQILESFHHPYYATGGSRIQHMMFEELEKWIGGLGPEEAERTLQALTKVSYPSHLLIKHAVCYLRKRS